MTGTHIAILVGFGIFFIGAITTLLLIFTYEGERAGPFGVVYGGLLYFLNGAAFQYGFWPYTVPFSIAVILIWAILSFQNVRDWLEAKFSAIGPAMADASEWVTDKMEERRDYRQAGVECGWVKNRAVRNFSPKTRCKASQYPLNTVGNNQRDIERDAILVVLTIYTN